MKHIFYIQAVAFALAISMAGCGETDYRLIEDDVQQVEGITLGMGELDLSSQATTKVKINGVNYAVNTAEDPTFTRDNYSLLKGRDSWKLDFYLYNGKNKDGKVNDAKYEPASFDKGILDSGTGIWKPNPDRLLYFPNYFHPHVEAWLYAEEKNTSIAKDQSKKEILLLQDQLFRPKSSVAIAKIFTVELRHQHAMIDFKFEGVARADIDESSVRVRVNGEVYTPFNVRESGILEYMLILPEKATSAGMTVEFNTNGNGIHQPISYKQSVVLNKNKLLGSNNCYCFTMSGKAMEISPITIINWTTGEPVLGEYVAVTAYPTFKGPKNSTFYFYYDNRLTEDGTLGGTPVLQEIAFNGYGECTIKPHGRVITHIFKGNNPSQDDWKTYKLGSPIILGDKEKMYINLEPIIGNLP